MCKRNEVKTNKPLNTNSGKTLSHSEGFSKRSHSGVQRTTGSTPSNPPIRKPKN